MYIYINIKLTKKHQNTTSTSFSSSKYTNDIYKSGWLSLLNNYCLFSLERTALTMINISKLFWTVTNFYLCFLFIYCSAASHVLRCLWLRHHKSSVLKDSKVLSRSDDTGFIYFFIYFTFYLSTQLKNILANASKVHKNNLGYFDFWLYSCICFLLVSILLDCFNGIITYLQKGCKSSGKLLHLKTGGK